jgi:CHASE3 domain sensor protein
MTETSSDLRNQGARRFALALIAVIILFCCAAAYGALHFVSLFEQEKAAQKAQQEKIQAVMLIQSSVSDLQGYVLGGDSRLTGRLSDKTSQFDAMVRAHAGDRDFQSMNDAFHLWYQNLAQPMLQKRRAFDTSSLNFSEMGIAYIQGNAPMHERRLEELSTQMLNAARDHLEAAQGRISGFLTPAIAVTATLGIAALALGLLLLKSA